MWGPRAEILVINLIHVPLTILLGIICVGLAIYTQVTGIVEPVLWVPGVAGAMAGLAMTADALIARQYAVLQMLGDVSSPPVPLLNRIPVGYGHATSMLLVLATIIYAEMKASEYFASNPFYQRLYFWTTIIYIVFCAAGWIVAAVFKPKFK